MTLEPRERLLATAYDLFSRHGVRAVGVDRIIAESGVAKMTFYRHFPSKDRLVVAFLDRRERLWTTDWLIASVEQAADEPVGRLLAVFDVFDAWFQREDFEGCSFINVLLEMGAEGNVGHASTNQLANIRAFLSDLARAAGVRDADHTARQIHILMKGSIVAAQEGDRKAAQRAREVAALLLAHETEVSSVQ